MGAEGRTNIFPLANGVTGGQVIQKGGLSPRDSAASLYYTPTDLGRKTSHSALKFFRHFPGEAIPTEVAIGCCLLVNWLLQVQIPGKHIQMC